MKLDNIISIKSNAFVYIKSVKDSFDLIFADPPYDLDGVDALPDSIINSTLLNEDGLFILEHSKDKDFSQHPNFDQKGVTVV